MTARKVRSAINDSKLAYTFVGLLGGAVLVGARADRSVRAVTVDVPKQVAQNTAEIAYLKSRMGKLEQRTDSVIRITTQGRCLALAQAKGTDWTECVK